MFSQEDKDEIHSRLVFSKLSNTFELLHFDGNFYVILQGVIVPYRIFVLVLCKYGLWQVRFSKADYYRVNKDLYLLWKELEIIPEEVDFYLGVTSEEAKVIAERENKRNPINHVKRALLSLEIEEAVLKFFECRGEEVAKYEALLHQVETQYEALNRELWFKSAHHRTTPQKVLLLKNPDQKLLSSV